MLRMPKYKYYFAAADLFIITASFIAAFFMNNSGREVFHSISGVYITLILLLLMLIFGFFSESQNLYARETILKRKEHVAAIGKVILYLTLLSTAFSFLSFTFNEIRVGLFSTFALSAFILFYVFRIEVLRFLLDKMDRNNILIVGNGETGRIISSSISNKKNHGIELAGQYDFNLNGSLRGLIEKLKIDEVLISPAEESYEEILELVEKCRKENVMVKLASEKFNIIPERLTIDKYFNVPVIDMSRKYDEITLDKVKRVVDLLVTTVGVMILSPLFIALALIIKLTSKGPVLYKQKRIGLNGKEFDFYKFRSMTVDDSDDEERKQMMLDYMKNNKAQKIINDKRVTSIGRIIRKTSIDELPQLINVLKGDMSLVGPRPCLPYEYENYTEWQKKRVKVMPGCTGVWQVSGRSSVTFNDSILLDLYYINNMSPWLDIKLILKTVPVMILSKGGK